jgi:mannose-1-phosphate guanylyltransferase
MKPLDGFILAAGLGTRMGPLSKVLPKPAWPLNRRPFLLLAADAMRQEGLERLAFNAHHLADSLRLAAQYELEICPEPRLLGSAGGLSHTLGRAVDPLAVWNGDALAEIPWRAFIAEHRRRQAQLSWLLVPHPGGSWNPVWLDASGRILPQGQIGQGPYHFTGASLWGPEALALIPSGVVDTKADILPHLTHHAGIVVEPFPWIEIGSPDQLIEAAGLLAPEVEGRFPGCYVHPAAVTHTAQLQRCILGPGAQLPAGFQDQNAFWYGKNGRQIRESL